jgi:hypothetical protein
MLNMFCTHTIPKTEDGELTATLHLHQYGTLSVPVIATGHLYYTCRSNRYFYTLNQELPNYHHCQVVALAYTGPVPLLHTTNTHQKLCAEKHKLLGIKYSM